MSNEEFVAEIQSGLNASKNMGELYERNRTLIHDVVVKYSDYDEEDDLMQEAYFGLSYAVNTFASDKGANFATYLKLCVGYQLKNYLSQNISPIRIPSNQRYLIMKYNRLVEEYRIKYGKFPSASDVATMLNMSTGRVEQLRKDSRIQIIDSLDRNIELDDDTKLCLIDTISDDRDCFEETEDRLFREELSTVLWGLVENLEPIQKNILKMRFKQNMTYEEISLVIGKSRERVHELQQIALRKLRKGDTSGKLKSFLTYDEAYSRGLQATGLGTFRRTNTSSVERAVILTMEENGELN